MHPGVWLAFGDLSGQDFWRNKARIVHVRFIEPPAVRDGQVTFTAENTFQAANGGEVCKQTSRLTLAARPAGYLLIWEATFRPEQREMVFGDQEEMGLGIRVATPIAVKQGGTIVDAMGRRNEREVWGNAADWCDYSGTIAGRHAGITTMCDPRNFRPSWHHARTTARWWSIPSGSRLSTRARPARWSSSPASRSGCATACCCTPGRKTPRPI